MMTTIIIQNLGEIYNFFLGRYITMLETHFIYNLKIYRNITWLAIEL